MRRAVSIATGVVAGAAVIYELAHIGVAIDGVAVLPAAVVGTLAGGAVSKVWRHLATTGRDVDRVLAGISSSDDGSGERAVWSSQDTEDLSPFGAWTHGDSVLPAADDTQEMPALSSGNAAIRDLSRYGFRVRRRSPGRHWAKAGTR